MPGGVGQMLVRGTAESKKNGLFVLEHRLEDFALSPSRTFAHSQPLGDRLDLYLSKQVLLRDLELFQSNQL